MNKETMTKCTKAGHVYPLHQYITSGHYIGIVENKITALYGDIITIAELIKRTTVDYN